MIKDELVRRQHLRALEGGRKCDNYSIWRYDENYAYITYLSNFKWAFVDEFSRKKYQVYMHMSKFMKTRNHNQIKSHHQKMMLKYGSIDDIIKGISSSTMELIHKIPEIMQIISEINEKFQHFFDAEGQIKEFTSITRNRPIRKKRRTQPPKLQEPQPQETPVKIEELERPYIYFTGTNGDLQEASPPAVKQEHNTFIKTEE